MDLLGEFILSPSNFSISETSDPFLLNNYKEVFSLSRFYSSLCTYFNENSPDENPLIYKVLVKVIEISSDEMSEDKKCMLSEMQDVLPCLVRWEIESNLFGHPEKHNDNAVYMGNSRFVEKVIEKIDK